MEQQLTLVDVDERSWELTERTREIGRLGLQQARQALERAPRRAA